MLSVIDRLVEAVREVERLKAREEERKHEVASLTRKLEVQFSSVLFDPVQICSGSSTVSMKTSSKNIKICHLK